DVGPAVGIVGGVGVVLRIRKAGPVPVDVAVDRLGVGIDQQLGGVAPVAFGGIPGSVHSVAVALTASDPGKVGVPAVGVDFLQGDAGLLAVLVEEAQLHLLRSFGEE